MLTLTPCFTFTQRLLGLHGHGRLHLETGLWIMPCAAIHTLGLTYCIDVIFLDAQDQAIRVCTALRPNRFAWFHPAHSVVECAAGYCQQHPDFAAQITQQCLSIRQRLTLHPSHQIR